MVRRIGKDLAGSSIVALSACAPATSPFHSFGATAKGIHLRLKVSECAKASSLFACAGAS